MINQLFERLGLTAKETSTFLTLLELGAQPVSVIAKHVGVPRSTMYLILESLKKAQLITEFKRSGIRYSKAISVREISDILEMKKRSIGQTEMLLKAHFLELESLESKLSITPHIKFFEGKEAVLLMYEAFLREKTFVAFFNPDLVKKLTPEYHYRIPESIKKKGQKVRELLINSKEAHYYKQQYETKLHQVKILPKTVRFESDTIICPEKIYMISYGEKDLSAIEIYNASLAATQKAFFDELWKRLD